MYPANGTTMLVRLASGCVAYIASDVGMVNEKEKSELEEPAMSFRSIVQVMYCICDAGQRVMERTKPVGMSLETKTIKHV